MMPRQMPRATARLDDLDKCIINKLQDGFPLCPHPFAEVAREIGCEEEELIARLMRLNADRYLTRFGPFYNAEAIGGAFCLCATAVEPERFEEVAEIVNSFSQVAHNYERTHALNMWFVLATESPDEIGRAVSAIEARTGCRVLQFPKLEEFFIGFRVAA